MSRLLSDGTASLAFDLISPGGFVADAVPDWVLYCHGFRSSPASVKAQKVRADFESRGLGDRLWMPQLPSSPAEAINLIQSEWREQMRSHPELTVGIIGSSLGGFYATVLAEQWPNTVRVVLLNPSVAPHESLKHQTGRQSLYFSEEEIQFLPKYLDALQALVPRQITRPERYLLVAATGDEVLDYSGMLARYPKAHQLRLQGSDHALTEFDQVWPVARLFLGLK